ncbi:tail fiber protein [Paenibacillus kribbensis]|uniref:tail fiber protein n=1 Tax=Paenibacillus kribbensis TaxID=172713 RepID=UPI002DBF7F9D|nr:tail fiber protein [Paenibacillus kribbensis]MEC0237764.1 tail fiber protein [Paenibacillus kribbensis]
MAFDGIQITNRGRNLLAKAEASQTKIIYTKFSAGDGKLSSQMPIALKALINEKISFPVSRLKIQNENVVVPGFEFSNQGVTTGFFFREVGLWATDPDLGEILYAYANSGEGAEYIDAQNTSAVLKKLFNFELTVSNTAQVTVVVDDTIIYATPQDVADALDKAKQYTDDQLSNVRVPDASLTQKGIAQLTNATNSTSETLVPTAKALKTTYDLANSAYRARGNVPSDWNTAILSGNYAVALANWTGYSNYPAGSYTYGKLVVHGDYGLRVQTYHTHDNPGRVYTRVSFNDTDWRAWTEVITSNTTANWQKYRLTTDTGSNILYISGDLNNLTKNGFYAGENLGNCPLGTALGTWAYIEVMSLDGTSGYVIQKLYALHGDSSFYMRTQKSGTWGPWSQDLFTSVASGKGDIAGAIIDRGGNANASNTFPELVTAIRNLPGKRFASGSFNGQSAQAPNLSSGAEMTLVLSGLNFTPSSIFIKVDLCDPSNTIYLSGGVRSDTTTSRMELNDGGFRNWVRANTFTQQPGGVRVFVSSGILRTGASAAAAVIKAYEWWAFE